MHPKKLVFLGSKPVGYHCFSHLLAKREEMNIEIIALLTNARKEFGNSHDLGALAESYDIPIIGEINEIPDCDIIYSVQYHKILSATHISKAKQAAVNLHMAPLPEYRGSNQFSYAIIDNKKEFGTTIHLIDTGIDHGDILFQKRFPIPGDCKVNTLYDLTFNASLELFRDTLSDVVNNNYNPIPQASLEEKYGTSLHYKKDIHKLKEIDLGWDKEKIERHIRATSMPGFEPPFCIINGEKLYFTTNHA